MRRLTHKPRVGWAQVSLLENIIGLGRHVKKWQIRFLSKLYTIVQASLTEFLMNQILHPNPIPKPSNPNLPS